MKDWRNARGSEKENDEGGMRNENGLPGQPVIPGEQRETRNPGAKTWIPACAGMATLLFFR